MAELKTKPNDASVRSFIDSIEDPQRKADSEVVMKLMRRLTGNRPKMWGSSIVGFGTYHYKYDSGREGEWFRAGFSPRKQSLTLYIMGGFSPHGKLMERLGKHTTGRGCLYIKKLENVKMEVLEKLIAASLKVVDKMDKS